MGTFLFVATSSRGAPQHCRRQLTAASTAATTTTPAAEHEPWWRKLFSRKSKKQATNKVPESGFVGGKPPTRIRSTESSVVGYEPTRTMSSIVAGGMGESVLVDAVPCENSGKLRNIQSRRT